jgi:hypothetical protein
MARVNSSHGIRATAAALALCVPLALAQGSGGTAASTTRISQEAGVTIKVTPVATLPGEWLFAIVLDAQSGALDDNLQAQAVLVSDSEQLKPIQWDGSKPGGQHRDGILSFPLPKSEAAAIELRIKRNGEAAARVFRWERPDLK